MAVYTFTTSEVKDGKPQVSRYSFEAEDHYAAGVMLWDQVGDDAKILQIRRRGRCGLHGLSSVNLRTHGTPDPNGVLLAHYVRGLALLACVPALIYLAAVLGMMVADVPYPLVAR